MGAVENNLALKCPRCYKISPASAMFCRRCGVRLFIHSATVAPVWNAPTAPPVQRMTAQPAPVIPQSRQFIQPKRRSRVGRAFVVLALMMGLAYVCSIYYLHKPTYVPVNVTPSVEHPVITYPRHDDSFEPYHVPAPAENQDHKYPERPSPYPYGVKK